MPEEQITITLTASEVDALKRAIRECTTNTGSADVKPLKQVAQKLDEAAKNLEHPDQSPSGAQAKRPALN
jgi:HPt (histidine-containing phosphotransfer) domain-containing protein